MCVEWNAYLYTFLLCGRGEFRDHDVYDAHGMSSMTSISHPHSISVISDGAFSSSIDRNCVRTWGVAVAGRILGEGRP